MANDFRYDVFLSHSSKDKAVVRPLAERLRSDGLRVWFDEWEIRAGDSIPAKIEEGLEQSRVLVLCMSANAFGSDWALLESYNYRFRDPLNKERRFIPLRLDEAEIKGSLAQFSYINWLPTDREQEYTKLLEACRPPAKQMTEEGQAANELVAERAIQLDHKGPTILSYAFSPNGKRALSGGNDNAVRVWDVETGRCLRVLEGHGSYIQRVAWSADQRRALSGSADNDVRVWDVETGRCLRVLEGHEKRVMSVAWGADQHHVLSSSDDHTLRLWDVETGRCLRVLEGHTAGINSLAWSTDQRRALSGSDDTTVRLWEVETGRCLRVLEGHTDSIWGVAWSADQRRAFSGDHHGGIRVWDLSEFVTETQAPSVTVSVQPPAPAQVQYTNAKVLLVGESGVGKTGLSKRLALNDWEPSDSTVGAWATQWKLPVASDDGVEREIWLWDFGGQADQRLIHQLYMDETALAVLVFDGQKEDLFDTLGQWDRDLTRASRNPFTKLLVAGRVDAGGLRVSRSQVETFAKERGYTQFLETSAKANICCEDLKEAILNGIQ